MSTAIRAGVLALSLGIAPSLIYAEEVRLVCSGVVAGTEQVNAGTSTDPYSGAKEREYADIPVERSVVHELRFDEVAGTFAIKGNHLQISKMGSEDGWIPAKTVEFSEAAIKVVFSQSGVETARDIFSLGAAKLFRPSTSKGTLDRYTGLWRLGSAVLPCQKADLEERKF
jgi:hypothetical protein